MGGIADWAKIQAGHRSSHALKRNGSLWVWGDKLGDGVYTHKIPVPTRIGLSSYLSIASDGYHVLVLRNDGTTWAWGDNYAGQLGDGSRLDVSFPIEVYRD